jgi:glycyl-tRNA synthetase
MVMCNIARLFVQAGLSNKLDSSGVTIGRKYARTDEIGIPYAVTIDGAADGNVTLRERDSTKQIRIPVCPPYHTSICPFITHP